MGYAADYTWTFKFNGGALATYAYVFLWNIDNKGANKRVELGQPLYPTICAVKSKGTAMRLIQNICPSPQDLVQVDYDLDKLPDYYDLRFEVYETPGAGVPSSTKYYGGSYQVTQQEPVLPKQNATFIIEKKGDTYIMRKE